MATLNSSFVTMLDLAQMPDNKDVAGVINLLAAHNPMVEDALALPCNKGTFHETTVLTGLPEVTWGAMYQGIPSTKGTRQSVRDTTGFVESASQVDSRIVDIYEDAEEKASVLLEEASSHLEAMAQEYATALIYHDTRIDPKKPMGLAPRFSSLSAENGTQIVDGGGSGAGLTSMWMVTWDKSGSHIIFPKGHKAGIDRVSRGLIPVADANGDIYMAHREEFRAHFGLSVRNWQYVSRGANIDVDDLEIDASTGANLDDILTEMYYKHKGRRVSMGKTCMYMNTTLVKFLDYQTRLTPNRNLFLAFDKYGPNAKEILHYRGVPIRESDAILSNEDEVV